MKNLRPQTQPVTVEPPPTVETSATTPKRSEKPLTAGILDPEKQRLVSNLLKSRFRSAGEMDITKEVTEAQEEERRKDIEVRVRLYNSYLR